MRETSNGAIKEVDSTPWEGKRKEGSVADDGGIAEWERVEERDNGWFNVESDALQAGCKA